MSGFVDIPQEVLKVLVAFSMLASMVSTPASSCRLSVGYHGSRLCTILSSLFCFTWSRSTVRFGAVAPDRSSVGQHWTDDALDHERLVLDAQLRPTIQQGVERLGGTIHLLDDVVHVLVVLQLLVMHHTQVPDLVVPRRRLAVDADRRMQ